MSNDKADATRHPLPSLDFVKPVGHDGEHFHARLHPPTQHMDAEADTEAPAPPAHMDEH